MIVTNAALFAAIAITLWAIGLVPKGDAINGFLEFCGGLAIWLSVKDLHKAKLVRGISWSHVAFFTTWGIWNLAYYPSLNQWFSFAGGIFLASVNALWLVQILYYLMKERHAHA